MSTQSKDEAEVRALYQQLIDGWNTRNADAMAAPFTEDGEVIGFDGSEMTGRQEITTTLQKIFAGHPVPPFVSKVKGVRFLGTDTAILRAIVGMVPPGKTDLDPTLNAHQTVVAEKRDGKWGVALFQNTPAQFHGRPELVQKMTEELKEVL
jgi:uncharacterized protein (TIGR02246 family)